MSFWEDPPPQPSGDVSSHPHEPVWMEGLRAWLMAPVIANAVVARSDTVALALNGVKASPVAWGFSVVAIPAPGHFLDPMAMMGLSMPPAMLASMERWDNVPPFIAHRVTGFARSLTIDVRYPDGTTALREPSFTTGGDSVPTGPRLITTAAGNQGSPGIAVSAFAVFPLPSAGDPVVVVRWPDEHVEESGCTISGALLRDAGARAVALPELDRRP